MLDSAKEIFVAAPGCISELSKSEAPGSQGRLALDLARRLASRKDFVVWHLLPKKMTSLKKDLEGVLVAFWALRAA